MTLSTWTIARIARLGPATAGSVSVERDLPVTMTDGTVLLAERWFAGDGDTGAPVVIVRTPYGRTQTDVIARLLAERGHTVVVQSCRGTFGSGGEFTPFFDEEQDGADLLTWLEAQSWASGEWLLFGVSYLGLTAWALKRRSPRAIGAMALAVTSTDFRRAVIWPSERFGLSNGISWRYGLRHQELTGIHLRRAQLLETRTIRRATRDGYAQDADIRAFGEPDQPYRSWLAHDDRDPWWDRIDFDGEGDSVPPLLQVAGWYDLFLDAQVDDYVRIRDAGRPVRLVIGPWVHGSLGLFTNALRETVELFTGARDRSDARIWFGGVRRWVNMPAYPPRNAPTRWSLGADGSLTQSGSAMPEGAAGERELPDAGSPAPTVGGRTLFRADAGRKDQRAREKRPDVLTYTTAALDHDIAIAGWPTAQLAVTGSDGRPWFVRLCDVSPTGGSSNVCDGTVPASDDRDLRDEESGERRTVDIRLSPTAHVFRRGHRIRLQVSTDASPTYARVHAAQGPRLVISDTDGASGVDLPLVALRRGRRPSPAAGPR